MLEIFVLLFNNMARIVELSTYSVVVAILLFPVYFKRLATINKKVVKLDYDYFPLPLKFNNLSLNYLFSKNVNLIINCDSISITKKPSQLKISIIIRNLSINFQAKKMIHIGIDQKQTEQYKEEVDQFFISKENHYHTPFVKLSYLKQLKYCFGLLIKGMITFFLSFTLSFIEITQQCKFKITLPQLYHATSQQVIPLIKLEVQNSLTVFSINEVGNIQLIFHAQDEVHGQTLVGDHEFVNISEMVVMSSMDFALNIDLMFQNSMLDIKSKTCEFTFTNQTLFITNIIWDEIYNAPSDNKCLKQLLQRKNLLKIGHPKHISLTFQRLVFNFALSDHLRYRSDLKIHHEVLQIYAEQMVWEFDFKFPMSTKNIRQKELIWSCKSKENGFRFKSRNQSKILWCNDMRMHFCGLKTFRSPIETYDKTDVQIHFLKSNFHISHKLIKYVAFLKSPLCDEVKNHIDLMWIEKKLVKQRRSQFLSYALKSIQEQYPEIQKEVDQQAVFNIVYRCEQNISIQVQNCLNKPFIMAEISGFEHSEQESHNSRILNYKFQELIISDLEEKKSKVTNLKLKQEIINKQLLNEGTKVIYEAVDIWLSVDTIDLQITESQFIEIGKLQTMNQIHGAFMKGPLKKYVKPRKIVMKSHYRFMIVNKVFSIAASSPQNRRILLKIGNINSQDFNNTQISDLSLVDENSGSQSTFFLIDRILWQANKEVKISVGRVDLKFDEHFKDLSWLVRSLNTIQGAVGMRAPDFQHEKPSFERKSSLDETQLDNEIETINDLGLVTVLSHDLVFSISKIQLEISDTLMNQHILIYRQFISKLQSGYPSHMREIDLMRSCMESPSSLLRLEINGFKFTLTNQYLDSTNIDSVLSQIFDLDSHPTELDQSFFKMITSFMIQLSIDNILMKVRDYTITPLFVQDIALSNQMIITQLNCRNVYLSLRVFYNIQMSLQKIESVVGLNLIFALRELQQRMETIIGHQEREIKKRQIFDHSLTHSLDLNFWDRLRLKFHGKINIHNDEFHVGMSTHIFPYSMDCLKVKLVGNSIQYHNSAFRAQFNQISLNRYPRDEDETSVINIPKVQVLGDMLWFSNKDQYDHYFVLHRPYLNQMNNSLNDFISRKFQLHLKVDCIQNEIIKEYDKNLTLHQNLRECLYFHYQTSFFQWLKQLPILRNETLRLYNIKLSQSEKNEDENLQHNGDQVPDDEKKMQFSLEKQNMMNYANYFSLITYTYARLIESLRIQGTLYKLTEFIQFKIFAHNFRFLFSNFQKKLKQEDDYLPFKDEEFVGIQILLENIQAQLKIIPQQNNKQEWTFVEQSFVLKLNQITGSAFNGWCILQPQKRNDQVDQEIFLNFFEMEVHQLDISKSQSMQMMRSFTDFHEIKQYLRNKKGKFIPDILNQTVAQYHLFEDVNEQCETSILNDLEQKELDSQRYQYNAFAIFVQAQDIQYEANKTLELKNPKNQTDDINATSTIVKRIKHFFTIKNCQFLFTFQLKELVIQVFEGIQREITKKDHQKEHPEVKKTDTSILNSINQFVRNVATQQQDPKGSPDKNEPKWGIPKQPEPESKEKVKTNESIFLLVNFIKPQFNLQYHGANAQMILTSPQDCYFFISEHTYDKLKFDKKRVCRLEFNGLECYIYNYKQDAKSNVHWLGKKGFDKIIHCDATTFTYQYFTLKESEVLLQGDKIQNLWNQEMRRDMLSVKVGSLSSDLNSHQFEMFNHMLEFVEMVTISTQEFDDMERSFKHKIQELEYHGARNLEALFKKKIVQNQDKYGAEKSRLEYQINMAMVQFLDDNNISFLQCKFETIRVIETFYNNESRKSEVLMQTVEVINRMFLGQNAQEYRQVLQQIVQTDKKTPIFRMVKKYFTIPLYSQQSRWFVYDQYDVKINPVMIKLTDELYDKFYSYFFEKEIDKEKQHQLQQSMDRYGKDKDKIKHMNENYNQKIPDLYQNIQVGELRLNVTFRHPSKLKRLKDVGVLIDPYIINKQVFWTTQEFFDDFAAFIIKQVSSQIFSILGQKLFGISREVTTQLTLE